MEFIAIFLFYAACYMAIVAVHEAGHYLAGVAGGIPPSAMRIRLFSFPQHVVLRSADRWVSPANLNEYVELIWRYLQTKPRVYLYVAGGFSLETIVTTLAAVVLIGLGQPKVATVLIMISLALLLFWGIVDAVNIVRSRIAGDLSGLWALAPVPTAVLILTFLAARGLTLWYAAAQ